MVERKRGRRRVRRARGAVLAEFVIAIMPILVIFFVFTQMAVAYIASITLRHASIMGARAAAVILPPNPGDVGPPEDVDRAVHESLFFDSLFEDVVVDKVPAPRPRELVTVTVHATLRCTVPLGARIVCGTDGRLVLAPVTARYPNHGAEYIR